MHLRNLLILILIVSAAAQLGAQSSAKYMKVVPQPDGTLYFIKPIKMKNPDGMKFEIDFTYFHEKTAPTGIVDMKFSVYSTSPVKVVDKLVFYYQKNQMLSSMEGIKLMYTEQQKGKWVSRFAANIKIEDLKALVQPGNEVQILPEISGQSLKRYTGGKSWEKMSKNTWGIFATMFD